MIKLVYCVRKRPDMSLEAFLRYWQKRHGPLVCSFAQALGIARYVQSHACEADENQALLRSRGLAAPYDGIAELWWDDMATYRRHVHSPAAREARRALVEDEAHFIEFAQSRLFVTEEHLIFDGRQAPAEQRTYR